MSPYSLSPPNKGDKIRSYHLLSYLSDHYRICLATFIDDPADWQYTDKVRVLCEDARFVALHPGRARLLSLRGLLTGTALTLPYYANKGLSDWVDGQVSMANNFDPPSANKIDPPGATKNQLSRLCFSR